MNHLLGSSVTYRIAIGPQQGRKVFTLQTLPDCEAEHLFDSTVGTVAGFSLHAGVTTRPMNGTNWNACAVTSQDLRYPPNACH